MRHSANLLLDNGEPTTTAVPARVSRGTALNKELIKEVNISFMMRVTTKQPPATLNAMTFNLGTSREYAIPARRRSGAGLLHEVLHVELLHAHARHGVRRRLGLDRHRRQC